MNRSQKSKVSTLLIASFGLIVSFQNCTPVTFAPEGSIVASSPTNASAGTNEPGSPSNPSTGNTPPPTGSTPNCELRTLTVPIKIMFIADGSGSNVLYTTRRGTETCSGPSPNCAPPTDPQKQFRLGSIQGFFQRYRGKPNFQWSFQTFAGNRSTPFTTTPSGALAFGNAFDMEGAIASFGTQRDYDATPYVAALEAARQAIASDPDLQSTTAAPLYKIIFMSDGYPTDVRPDGSGNDALSRGIRALGNLSPGRVSMSTVYYGTIRDQNAAGLLSDMARAGGGQFIDVDTSSTTTIDIDDLIRVPDDRCR